LKKKEREKERKRGNEKEDSSKNIGNICMIYRDPTEWNMKFLF
jgi:hypothetical protein